MMSTHFYCLCMCQDVTVSRSGQPEDLDGRLSVTSQADSVGDRVLTNNNSVSVMNRDNDCDSLANFRLMFV